MKVYNQRLKSRVRRKKLRNIIDSYTKIQIKQRKECTGTHNQLNIHIRLGFSLEKKKHKKKEKEKLIPEN